MIQILKGGDKRKKIRRKVPKRVCNFGLVWGAGIYSCTERKDGQKLMEILIGDVRKSH